MKTVLRISMSILALGVAACTARASVGVAPTEECRTVEVRTPRDLETCRTRCSDEGCRTRCTERAQYARQHRCWVE